MELPGEIANSGDIPVTLLCGHVFGTECIYSWITWRRDENPPSCPLCRARLECVENRLTEYYVEVIKVPCPEMGNPERVRIGIRELTTTLITTWDEWEGR